MTQNIYDNPMFFEGYSQLGRSIEGLDGAAEWPALRACFPIYTGAGSWTSAAALAGSAVGPTKTGRHKSSVSMCPRTCWQERGPPVRMLRSLMPKPTWRSSICQKARSIWSTARLLCTTSGISQGFSRRYIAPLFPEGIWYSRWSIRSTRLRRIPVGRSMQTAAKHGPSIVISWKAVPCCSRR